MIDSRDSAEIALWAVSVSISHDSDSVDERKQTSDISFADIQFHKNSQTVVHLDRIQINIVQSPHNKVTEYCSF